MKLSLCLKQYKRGTQEKGLLEIYSSTLDKEVCNEIINTKMRYAKYNMLPTEFQVQISIQSIAKTPKLCDVSCILSIVKKIFQSLVGTPTDLEPIKLVFQVRLAKEIFSDYQYLTIFFLPPYYLRLSRFMNNKTFRMSLLFGLSI